jgi:hypothetical protein
MKSSSDGGDSGSKKFIRAISDACGGGLVRSAFSRSLGSGCRFCVGAFGTNLIPVAVKMY